MDDENSNTDKQLSVLPDEDNGSHEVMESAEIQHQSTHINMLTKKILGQVLREVPILDRLANCEGVSRRWKSTLLEFGWIEQKKLDSNFLYVEYHNGHGPYWKFGKKMDAILVSLFRRIGPFLVELRVVSFTDFPIPSELYRSFHLVPKLAKLDITQALFKLGGSEAVEFLPETLVELRSKGPYDQNTLEQLSLKCPNLQSIHFNDPSGSKVPVAAMNTFLGKYPNLTELHLNLGFIESAKEGSASLVSSLGGLHQLRVLSLGSMMIFDDAVLTAVATGCRQLRRICLSEVPVSEGAIEVLENLPYLVDLELTNEYSFPAQKAAKHWKLRKYKTFCSRMLIDDVILQEAFHELTSLRQRYFFSDSVYELIEWGVLPFLIKCLSSTNGELKYEGVAVLALLLRDSRPDQTLAVVEAGAVPKLMELLDSGNPKLVEQSLCSIAKIIDDGSEFPADRWIEPHAIVEHSLKMVDSVGECSGSTLKYIANIFAALLSQHKKSPPLSLDIAKSILPALGKLLQMVDADILRHTALAISNFIPWEIDQSQAERIQLIIDLGVVPRLVSLLSHSKSNVQLAALSAIMDLSKGTSDQIQLLLDAGALKAMPKLISYYTDEIEEMAVAFLSNAVAVCNEEQIQAVVDMELVPVLIYIAARGREPTLDHATWTIAEMAGRASAEQAMCLVDQGVISSLCNVLCDGYRGNKDIVASLKGLSNILEKSGGRREEICQAIVDCKGAFEEMKQLRNHRSEDVSKIADQIVDSIFSLDRGRPQSS